MYTPPLTEHKRKEIIQEVIDRMLYLPIEKRQEFMKILIDSFEDFPVDYEVNNRGVKVFLPLQPKIN
jgi:hypothetical protein